MAPYSGPYQGVLPSLSALSVSAQQQELDYLNAQPHLAAHIRESSHLLSLSPCQLQQPANTISVASPQALVKLYMHDAPSSSG